MPWTTIQQVADLTGETVDARAVAVASAMIDTKCGVSDEIPPDAIGPRDRKTLARAAAWQAAWIAPKLDQGLLTQRENSRSTSASGVAVTRGADADALYAPMALLEIKNLSWFGTTREDRRPSLPARADFLNERSDEFGTWVPL